MENLVQLVESPANTDIRLNVCCAAMVRVTAAKVSISQFRISKFIPDIG